MRPKVSIVIPVYNAEKYLKECLESLVNQTLKEIEIICVNDGSTDNSLKILNEYSKKYNNIRIINQENSGAINARINGYKNACGEYVAWVDNDDFSNLDMYEKMYNMAISNDYDVVISNYNFYPQQAKNKKKWFKDYNGIINWHFISRNTVLWNKIVKKEYLDSIDFIKIFSEMGEGCYNFVLINTNKIISFDECLYNYRVGHSSLSGNYKNIDWYKKTVDRAYNQFKYSIDNRYDDCWVEYFDFCYLYYILIYMIVLAYNNDKKQYKEYKKILKNSKIFSKKYKEYMLSRFSYAKYLFFKYFGSKNYYILKLSCKLFLK